MIGTDTNKSLSSPEDLRILPGPICAFFADETQHDCDSALHNWLEIHGSNNLSELILACAVSPQWQSKIPYSSFKAARQVRDHQACLGEKQMTLTALRERLLSKYPTLKVDIQVKSGNPAIVATEICRQYRCPNILLIGSKNHMWWQQIRSGLAATATTIELMANG